MIIINGVRYKRDLLGPENFIIPALNDIEITPQRNKMVVAMHHTFFSVVVHWQKRHFEA